jgi:hypothetical protein
MIMLDVTQKPTIAKVNLGLNNNFYTMKLKIHATTYIIMIKSIVYYNLTLLPCEDHKSNFSQNIQIQIIFC